MAITVKELKEWLNTLDDEREVGEWTHYDRCGDATYTELISFARNKDEKDESVFLCDH
jgi:hypothetical protein